MIAVLSHASFSASASLAADAEAPRPNIVVILADDMGFSDAGCYGGEIRTPNVDRLAAGGLRFSQFYNCARCCPTRASLMTGQYAHKVGLAINGRSLTTNGLTIAEAMHAAGYNTAMAGKWHLSETLTIRDKSRHQLWLDHAIAPDMNFGPPESYPANRGFDRFYGIIWGVVDYFDPFSLVEGLEPVREVPDDYYITDAITDKAVEYVRAFGASDKPFFLYVAHCAPHWPLHALPEDIARYRDRYQAGWHALRRERFARQLQMGLFDEGNTSLPQVMGEGPDWDKLTTDEREFQSAKMSVHAAMVDHVDQGIGKLLAALEAAGRLDDTVIFFLCDNGASPEIPRGPGYDRSSATRDGQKIRYDGFSADEVGSETTYTGIGSYWANAANTPFRYWKKESFEGGNHTPLVVHWPAGLKAMPGGVTDQVGHVIDLLPTCLELAGVEYPESYNGNRLTPLDGKSLLPILPGGERTGHDVLFFEHVGGRAVREGDWKLVAPSNRSDDWELYNLAQDRTETDNLAARFPDRVNRMRTTWQMWFDEVMHGNRPHTGQ